MARTSVLVVEDERIIAKGIEARLAALGYTVAGSAATGEDAVRLVAALNPDIVLMDIRLGPGMDGVAAAAEIRDQFDVPVVFLTAHSDDATLDRAKESEPYGYVVKPFEDTDLHTALQIALYRHQAERQVRENERWLAATLGSIGDGVVATDARGRVRFLNHLAARMTGWTQADAIGRDVRDVFRVVNEFTREAVPNPALQAIERRDTVELARDTVLLCKTGGEIPVEDTAAPIRDAAGRAGGAVLVFRDVTERRQLEAHLRQAQKMEAIGRLAGGIAHDFNNIMTVITGFSELLLSGAVAPGDAAEPLRQMHEAGKRAAALTRQILAFSRKQVLTPTVLDLNAVVRDTADMLRKLIGEDVELVTDLSPGLRPIKADPSQIEQVVLNLSANARDAMPGGGRLVVSTRNTDVEPSAPGGPPDIPPDVPPGAYAELSFADTGCGMPPEVLARVFEPFYTTKAAGEGTGLGLATVHGIVKQSGGYIDVRSEPGKGATFRLLFPAVTLPPPPAAAPTPRRAPTGAETILVVEDDETVRRMTRMILEGCGYTVLEAQHGNAATRVVANHPGDIHLLVTDMVMPGESGRALAIRLRDRRPRLRVLFVSGYNDELVTEGAWDANPVDFLAKPFGREALATKVREILDRP